MKKRLFLTLIVVATLMCMFAISVSAVEVDGIYYTLNDGENPTAVVNNENATKCILTDVVIPETITYNDVTYTVTTIDHHAFSGTQSGWGKNQTIKTLYIPETVTSIGTHFLRQCESVESVVIKAKNPNGIVLSNAEFYGCTGLISIDMSESDITSFVQYTLHGCSALTTIKFPPNLKTLGSQAFRFCSSITTIDLLDTKVESIGNFCFNSCSQLTKLRLSTTLKSIAGNAIQGVKITELVLPHGFTTTTGNAIPALSSLYMMVFPELDETSSFSSGTFYGTYPELVIYAGDKDSCEKYLVGTEDDKKLLYGYNVLPISEYDSSKTYTGKNLFYGATTCSNCNGLLEDGESFIYKDYLSEFGMGQGCTNCDNVTMTKKYDPMFTCLGYSKAEDANDEFTIGYTVNFDSVKFYEEMTSNEISCGMYIALYDVLGTNDILNADATATEGVLKIDLSGTKYNKFSAKVLNIKTEEQKATKLLIGAYVISKKDEEIEISYLDQGKKDENDKYCYITYNDII